MRIGILTFHRSYNYGAFMQCYSLVTQLKRDFPQCDIEAIDYNTVRSANSYKNILANSRGKKAKNIAQMFEGFDQIRTQYLPVSPEYIESDCKEDLFKKIHGRYDIIVVGSDAVWNWVGQPFPNAYMLNGMQDTIKMSYAASAHGQPYKNLSKEILSEIENSINDFKYVGVREYQTDKLLRFANVKSPIYQNCDPSVLLNLQELPGSIDTVKRKFELHGVDFNKPIIGVMAAAPYGKVVKKYFGNKVQLVSVYKENPYCDFYINDLNPFEWARAFSLFNVTLTHFFHGTMFSLLNGTPVIAVEKKTRYNMENTTKIHNALYNMGLEMFYFCWDRGSQSVFNKAMYKLNIKQGHDFWFAICNKMEEWMTNPPKDKIREAIKKESHKYLSFKNALSDILTGM